MNAHLSEQDRSKQTTQLQDGRTIGYAEYELYSGY